MPGTVRCPHCGAVLRYSTPTPPKRGKCPKCQQSFETSSAPPAPTAPPLQANRRTPILLVVMLGLFTVALAMATIILWAGAKRPAIPPSGAKAAPPSMTAEQSPSGAQVTAAKPSLSDIPKQVSGQQKPDEAQGASTILGRTSDKEPTPQEVAKTVLPSVVTLVMQDRDGKPVSLGSGFFIDEVTVVTNWHVVEKAPKGTVKLVGRNETYDIAGLAASDQERDLALIRLTGAKGIPLSRGKSEDVRVGDKVYVIGAPMGMEGTFSEGMISAIRQQGDDRLFQITAPISPGSSGGPLLDTYGRVVGVTVGTIQQGQNLNFAIPLSYVFPLLAAPKEVTALPGKLAEARWHLEPWGEGENLSSFLKREALARSRFEQDVPVKDGAYVRFLLSGSPLAGLSGVKVVVEEVKPDVQRAGLTQQMVQTEVELRLRRNGITVITGNETSPYFYVNVGTLRADNLDARLFVYTIRAELNRTVYLDRPPPAVRCTAPVWEAGQVGYAGENVVAQAVREAVGNMVDEFANAYLAAKREGAADQ